MIRLYVLFTLGGDACLGLDLVVVVIDGLFFDLKIEDPLLEGVAEELGLLFRTTLGDHQLPVLKVGIVEGLLGKELDPAVEFLGIQLRLIGGVFHLRLRLTGNTPSRDHVGRGLRSVAPWPAESPAVLVKSLCHRPASGSAFLTLLFVEDNFRVGNEVVFLVSGAGEDAAERVVVFAEDGVVLVIVAAGAGDGQAQETAGDGVDALVALVGAALNRLGLIPNPGSAAEEAGRLEVFGGGVLAHQVAGELHLDELAIGKIVVELLDDPVAVDPGAIERHVAAPARIETANVVVAVAGDVEPVAAPALAVGRRCEETVDHLGEGLGGGVLFEGGDLGGGGRKAGEVEGGATDQGALVRHGSGLQTLLHKLGEDEAVDVGFGPGLGQGLIGRVLDDGDRGVLERDEGPPLAHVVGDLFAGADGGGALGPGSAHADPVGEDLDLVGGELGSLGGHF